MTNLERRSFSYYETVINLLQLKESAQSAKIMDYEKRLCDVARLANRIILIGEEEGWFEWKGDADNGGNHSSLHRDLTKVANQRVYKDFCDMHVKMINTLEHQLADYKKRIEELEDAIYAKSKQVDELKAQRMELWMLLDNIDTSEDIAKDSDKLFRNLCRNEYPKRWDIYEPNDMKG